MAPRRDRRSHPAPRRPRDHCQDPGHHYGDWSVYAIAEVSGRPLRVCRMCLSGYPDATPRIRLRDL